jgi:hypothetical protein
MRTVGLLWTPNRRRQRDLRLVIKLIEPSSRPESGARTGSRAISS